MTPPRSPLITYTYPYLVHIIHIFIERLKNQTLISSINYKWATNHNVRPPTKTLCNLAVTYQPNGALRQQPIKLCVVLCLLNMNCWWAIKLQHKNLNKTLRFTLTIFLFFQQTNSVVVVQISSSIKIYKSKIKY